MAITAIEYKLLRDLHRAGLLPPAPHVVEFGEANWYGDVPPQALLDDVDRLVTDTDERARTKAALLDLFARDKAGEDGVLFEVARLFYRVFVRPASWTAVDMGGTERALKLDLNGPVSLARQFDLTLNFGTAEHIFDVAQFFRTVHEVTRPGGLMIHACPFHGWTDHGFWNIQPTVYADVAHANGYRVLAMIVAQINPPRFFQMRNRDHVLTLARDKTMGENATYAAVLQKSDAETPFKVPMQGYYDGRLSAEANDMWRELR